MARIIKILREITDNLSGVFRRIFLRDERFYPLGLGIVVPAFVRPAEAKFVPYQAAFVDDVQRRIQKRTAGHIVVIIAECRNVVIPGDVMLYCQDFFVSKIIVAQNAVRNMRLGMPIIQRNGPPDVAPLCKIFAVDVIFWNDMKLRQIERDSFYHILP